MKIDINKALCRIAEDDYWKHVEEYNRVANIQFLNVLHFQFGFGERRLIQALRAMRKMQKDYLKRYEMEETDTPFICEYQLTHDHIDIEKIFKEGDKDDDNC